MITSVGSGSFPSYPGAMSGVGLLGFAPSPITLGSVQFGLRYGVVNPRELPDEGTVFRILDYAIEAGITTIDSARAYGAAEDRIGRWLASRSHAGVCIVTKVPPLPQAEPALRLTALRQALAQSCASLGLERLQLVLVHEEHDLLDPYIVEEFEQQVRARRIGNFGASVYRPEIALRLIRTVPLAALQIPASIVDHRFERAGVLSEARRKGISLFVRSAFTQGVMLTEPSFLPAHLEQLGAAITRLRDIAKTAGRTMTELALAPLRDDPNVTSIVLGVDSVSQLRTNLEAMRSPGLPAAVTETIRVISASLDDRVVDPSQWKALAGLA